ncbi:MAG TPA: HU family DNA-binding protein [Cytophagaceae bacterium]
MTKAEVINKIAERTGVNKSEVTDIVESFLAVVKESLAEGNEIFIRGFGSFINQKRARKVARNISKNTAMIIEEHYIPKFKPSNEFKDLIKNSKAIGNKPE